MSITASNHPADVDGLVLYHLRLVPAEGTVEPCLTLLQNEGQGLRLLVFPKNGDMM